MDKLKNLEWNKWGMNLVKFTFPALGVFFGQLAMKVDPKAAILVALLAFYGTLADFFKKYKEA